MSGRGCVCCVDDGWWMKRGFVYDGMDVSKVVGLGWGCSNGV